MLNPNFQTSSLGEQIIENAKQTPILALAPMEDVTNLPFRLLIKEIACPDLMFTEFVSAMAIHYGAVKTLKKMQLHAGERPLGIQIFGAESKIMADTAKLCEDMGADIVDINMGCWVPKVCKTGSGAALLKDPEIAAEIVRSVVNAVSIPVTVKIRAGWDYSLFAAPELVKRFEDVGARMVTLHARFAKQGIEGQANWDLIKELRSTISIPLIGNGDVKMPQDALKMLQETGCNGVMVGRAAISNPWALRNIRHAMQNGILDDDSLFALPDLKERIRIALLYTQWTIMHEAVVPLCIQDIYLSLEQIMDRMPAQEYGIASDVEQRAMRSLRGQLPLFIKHEPGSSALRSRITACHHYEELLHIFTENFV